MVPRPRDHAPLAAPRRPVLHLPIGQASPPSTALGQPPSSPAPGPTLRPSVSTRGVVSTLIRPAAAILLALTPIVAFVVARPDCMLVERVVFEGRARAGEAALRHLADIPNGTTIWTVDLEAAARGVERHPWVRRARAVREWPDRVVVEIEEYEPVALLHYDRTYYVDRDGTPFLADATGDLDYPSITGIGPDLERAHPDLPRLAVRDALRLIDALDARGLLTRDRISEVAFSRTRGFTVHGPGARFAFGVDDLERKLDRLERLVAEGQVDPSAPLMVDLAPETVAIVRPLDAPSAGI